MGALDFGGNGVKAGLRSDVQSRLVNAAEGQVRWLFRHGDEPNLLARGDADDRDTGPADGRAHVHVALVVHGHAVAAELRPQPAVRQSAVGTDIVGIGLAAAVAGTLEGRDVQRLSIRGRDDAIGAAGPAVRGLEGGEGAGEGLAVRGEAVDGVDVLLVSPAVGPPLARPEGVREVQAVVRHGPHVVRAAELPAVVFAVHDDAVLGQHNIAGSSPVANVGIQWLGIGDGFRHVGRDLPQLVALVGARDELAVLVEGHAIGIARRVHEEREPVLGHRPLEDLVGVLVDKVDIASSRVAGGALGEGLVDRVRLSGEGCELGDLSVGVDCGREARLRSSAVDERHEASEKCGPHVVVWPRKEIRELFRLRSGDRQRNTTTKSPTFPKETM